MSRFHNQWLDSPEPEKPAWLDNWCELNGVDPTWNTLNRCWMLNLVMVLPVDAPRTVHDVSPETTLEEFLVLIGG